MTWEPGIASENTLLEIREYIAKIASAIDDSGDTPYINVSGVDGGSA